jgi:hypothetical protein
VDPNFITAFDRRARLGEWRLCGGRPVEQLRLKKGLTRWCYFYVVRAAIS